MVESNAAKSASTWAKTATVLAGGALVCALVAPALYMQDAPNVLTEDQIQASVQKAIALQALDINVSEGPKTIAIYEEIFQEDAFGAESEVIATEELEDDDYEALAEYLNISEDDISEVKIKDIDVSIDDVDDKDSTVEIELKVYFENGMEFDIDSKRYITATVVIEDGEVENISFMKTA